MLPCDYFASMKASRGILLVALGLLALAALRDFARLGDALPWRQLYDFADFYCAGAALDRGADPYRYEPLHRCEHTINNAAAFRGDPNRVIPAPLPPFDFPPLALLARLSFSAARTVAAGAIVAAVIGAIAGLCFLGVGVDVAALALALPAGYILLSAGQVVPFALVALVFCGVALARRRDRLAGVLAALTLIEPHLGLPVCVAVFVWMRRARMSLVVSCIVLAGISLWLVGVAGLAEYLFRVLPGQAAAETGYVYQFSLAYLLNAGGVPAQPALLAGEISYIVMLAFGVWLGGALAARLARAELVAYLPAACSLIGGAYVHMVDLAFAIPAALILATALEGRSKSVAALALCLLAVPWIVVWITKKLFLTALLIVAALLWRLRIEPRLAVAAFAAIAAGIYLLELAPPAPLIAMTPGNFTGSDLAQQAWSAYVVQLGAANPPWFIVKLPVWGALVALVAAGFSALRRPAAPVPLQSPPASVSSP
jgi:hypothetical protein